MWSNGRGLSLSGGQGLTGAANPAQTINTDHEQATRIIPSNIIVVISLLKPFPDTDLINMPLAAS